MGYKHRQTSGKVECRPKEFRYDFFPKQPMICSERCPYFIFCQTEFNKMILSERIKNIRIILQKPNHALSVFPDGQIILLLEDDEGKRLSFRGKTIVDAVKTAEEYIEHERTVGSLRFPERKEEEDKKN